VKTRLTLAATAILIALTGCGSSSEPADPTKTDQEAGFACDDFALGYKSAQTTQARIDLADKVNKWAPHSQTNRIADMGAALSRGAEASPDAWQLAADAFAQACMDAGWEGS